MSSGGLLRVERLLWTCADISKSVLLPGKLPGKVFGRLCDCAEACTYAAEVNTALSCTANFTNTIIVSHRLAALAVLEHMRQQRAGVVKCLIVDEASSAEQAPVLPPAHRSLGAQPLAQSVVAQTGQEAALPVIQGLLANWLVVPDWKAAEQCAHAQKSSRSRFGVVTQCALSFCIACGM